MRWLSTLACILSVLVGSSIPAAAEKRVALVIGNSSYVHVGRLLNPANDAKLMADTLKSLGFTLVGGGAQLDLDKAGFDRVVQDFGARLQGADVGLFYFAGHGVQVRGANYLVPVGANPTREADVSFQMLDTNLVLQQMEGSGTRLNLVILDACRNNPFAGRGLRSGASGLATIQAPEGTLISFATQPGNVAKDGDDGNSPYTKALAQTLRRPGLDIFQTFNEVGLAVKRATGNAQQPWVSSSPIAGTFYFAGLPATPSVAPSQPVAPADPDAAARRDYELAERAGTKEAWDAFLARHPTGYYADLARVQRDKPLAASLPPASVVPTRPAPPSPGPASLRITRADVIRLFNPLSLLVERVRSDYLDKVDDRTLVLGALEGMRRAFPSVQSVRLEQFAATARSAPGSTKPNLNPLYDAALHILDLAVEGDDARLLEAAILGMMSTTDAHSSYLSPKEFRDMQVQTRGEFGGLGIEVTIEPSDQNIKVVAAIDDTPAHKAGLLTGDIITHVDDEPVRGLTLNRSVEKMRGPVNTKIKLRIQRKGVDLPIEVTIVRDIIRAHPVRSRLEGGDVGYVRISQFNEQTTDGVKKALADLTAQVSRDKLKGFIIDLRNNPGGLLDQAISISDLFLEKGEIVSTRGRTPEETQRFNARAGDLTNGRRLIVLINGGSASASEIVAGALQDHRRATVIGTRSFGKGSVQTIIPLDSGNGALRLTTAGYFTPSGRSIQAKGITPDIEVNDALGLPQPSAVPAIEDNALAKALALLRSVRGR